MGLSIDRDEFDAADHARFAERLSDDLAALRALLATPGFGEGEPTLGAELELSLVDAAGRALPLNRDVLVDRPDPQVQLELDRFNLEYNLTPVPLAGRPFAGLEAQMDRAIALLGDAAAGHGGRVVAIGILPTLRADDLVSHAMTDLPRYRALSAGIRRLRRAPFEVRITGHESLTHSCDDVTLEGAATALQVHLRVAPAEFASTYNAVQLATAPALAAAGNSPIFLGRRLWDETRVALFKQAVDHRAERPPWRRPARVSFGHGWVREGAYELFAETVSLFPPLLPMCGDEDPLGRLREGALPGLDELRLHQGTVWRWNRAIYDPEAGGHLRIEMRALPSGPTPRDMAASGAFMLGLALGLRADVDRLLPGFPFEWAEHSFYRAAQDGLAARLLWPVGASPSPREVGARELVRELLPVAERGLAEAGLEAAEVEDLLAVIRARAESETTGASWQRRVLERHERVSARTEALAAMLEGYVSQAASRRPVHEWSEGA